MEDIDANEIEAVIACLGDDAAQLHDENPEDERADNMVRAADLLRRLADSNAAIARLLLEKDRDGCKAWARGIRLNMDTDGGLTASASAPVGEPVAWLCAGSLFRSYDAIPARLLPPVGSPVPLYASPLPQEPREAEGMTDEDRAILEAVRRELEEYDGNAPGHAHEVPGIWDSDNGAKSGQPCAWCLTWKKFTRLIEEPNAIQRERKAGEATTDQLLELAGALEQRRGLQIVANAAKLAEHLYEGPVRSGWEMACEEITERLRTEVWEGCLPPVDAPPSPTLNESADSRGEKG